jgi:dolichyl-phosphate-mannose--protein O-mannosyl transferase
VSIPGGREGEPIRTVSTKFKLIHYFQHCAVTAPGKQLPKWGFEQQEVSCNPNLRDKNGLWNVEDNFFELCKWSEVDRAMIFISICRRRKVSPCNTCRVGKVFVDEQRNSTLESL